MFGNFRRQHISPKAAARRGKSGWRPVKIAVLDTGINTKNAAIRSICDTIKSLRRNQDRSNPIQAVKSFTKDHQRKGGLDTCGHGTHVAWLLLKNAPDANIYVAKVAEDIHRVSSHAIVNVSDSYYLDSQNFVRPTLCLILYNTCRQSIGL